MELHRRLAALRFALSTSTLAALSALVLPCASALAQTVTMPFAAEATAVSVPVPVPPWAIATISLLLAALAFRTLRARSSAKIRHLLGWASMTLISVVLLATTSPGSWIARALASPFADSFNLTLPSPTVSPVLQTGVDITVTNATGQRIILGSPNTTAPYQLVTSTSASECIAGLALAPDANCALKLVVNAANHAPSVSAGADQTITLPAVANLAGSASDDGLPNPPGALTTTWNVVSGPGSVALGNGHAVATTATFTVAGVYVLRLTADDSALTTSSTLQVTVNDVLGAGPQLAPIADRTIALGARFQQLLQATAANVNETLTFGLPTAPANAALSPSPLIDWTPTLAQLGINHFTASVTDSHAQTATRTFTVTVTHINQPPQLAPQADATVRIGAAFARTINATDPDAGDALTFALVTGPAGMVLSSANLSWPTAGKAIGDYPVTVRVTDSGGLSDTKLFTIKLLPLVSPVAVDDSYSLHLGETLNVSAPGVLANDLSPDGQLPTATKLTDPDKGALTAFGSDGGFSYTAPSVAPGSPFQPVLKWNNAAPYQWGDDNPLVADVFGNGHPVVFTLRSSINAEGIVAIDGTTGATLWQVNDTLPAPNAGCHIYYSPSGNTLAVGDIDDSGVPAIVGIAYCDADNSTAGSIVTRMVALNARTGELKWLTAPLGAPRPAIDGGGYFQMTSNITPAIARLHPLETPSVLFKQDVEGYLDNAHQLPACDQLQANSGLLLCTGVIALNGLDGSVRQRFIAPNDNLGRENYYGGHVVVADLGGGGAPPNVMANGAVWDADGNLVSNRLGVFPNSITLAKLDDSGQISIISYEGVGQDSAFIVARHANGSVQWQSPIYSTGSLIDQLSVADLDGDGSPEIMAFVEGYLFVYDAKGDIKWIHRYADASNNRTIDQFKRPAAFDLDGDGIAEVIVPTMYGLEFTDGATGKTKAVVPWPDLGVTNTGYAGGYVPAASASAVVADIDGSGHASVVVTIRMGAYGASHYIVAIGAQNNDWRPAPRVFNEFSYHVSNVDNDGHIPTVETNNFATPSTNVFGNQPQTLAPVDPRATTSTTFQYTAGNGALNSAPATVTLTLLPNNRPPVFTSTAPTHYLPTALTYAVHAVDPDPNDSVSYSILTTFGNNASSCSVDATSGLLTCPSLWAGDQVIVLVATDSFGAAAYQTVRLSQSAGPATVPNVVGQSKTMADASLLAAGFVTGNVSSTYFAAPVDQVLTQYPAAGASVLAGEAIALQVSLGLQPQPVPDLLGLSLTQAKTQLTGLGFAIVIDPVISTTVPASQVMGQSPAFGILLAPGDPVTLSVSVGPPLTGTVAQVIVEPAPTALRLVGETVDYRATAIFTDGTSTDVTIRSVWNSTTPAVASVDGTGGVKALTAGGTTISAAAGGRTGQSTLNVVARTAGDQVTPVAQISAPTNGATVTGPTAVTGTASDANFLRYELAYALAGDTTWTVISEGSNPVTAGTLGSFDPTTLINDLYTLRLTVFDRNDNQTVTTVTVQISGGQKPGLFTLAYQDLNLPAAGIPITITRTYDSRDKAQGDFGIGWRLGFQTLRLRTNRVPGTGWVRTNSGATVILNPTSEHKVSVTLPDGKIEEFDLVLWPTSNLGGLDATAIAGYAPRPGTVGQLEMLDNPNLLVVNGGAEDELVDDSTFNTFEPVHYRYTLLDGTLFEIHRTEGVKKITDRNGNSVSFGPGGIIHSSGQSALFARDVQGRITQITDPLGNAQTYSYDGNGDLASHTGATSSVSRYRYDWHHNLIDIQDPAGNHAVRNEYDAAGHLIATTDANGHQITYANDPGTQTEIVTDRRGVVTQILYDAIGNVTSMQTGVTIEGMLVLAQTTKSYDALNNETSAVNPDGLHTASSYSGLLPLTRVIDPSGLNLGQTFAYNTRNDVTNATDAGGRAFAFTYDTNGNLTGFNTPLSGTGSSVADAQGLPVQNQDALGNTAVMTRDGAGNVTREDLRDASSALLRRTDFTYDGIGNKLSETRYRSISGVLTPFTTQFAYDSASRLIGVTDPLGSVSRTEYDVNGRVTVRTDPLGRHTTYLYDALGKLTQTTAPDGSSEMQTYDVNGNLATSTDAAGRATSFGYDELNRQVRVTLPSGAFTQTIYSPGGRVDATIDALGNRSDYAYDTAGRRISTTLPAVINGPGGPSVRPQVSSTLNALGASLSTTDPSGRTANYEYDANGRLTKTTFVDGSVAQQTFDTLGRRTSVTNEEGQTTNFGYDGLGHLISASGLAGDATYAYDEMGNLVAQTDALGRVTQFRYDARNRLTHRRYPGGETEQFAYDAVGNMVAVTDGLGRTITFGFDAMNRMTSKTLPGGVTIGYSYTPDGQRASVTDPRGVTTYGYDSLGRLASVSHPTGETVNYVRDANGNLLSLASPAANVSYGYDALDRLVQVDAPEGPSQTFHDLSGNRLRQTAANGVVTDAVFDARDRPTLLTHKSGATTLQSYASAYSPSGRRTQVTELDGSVENYTYDAKGRLASEVRTGTNPRSITHDYDAVGNRLHTASGGAPTTFSYDSDDHLLSDGTVTYAWDANGNLASTTQDANVLQYGYDAENRLVSITGGGLANQYAYDADGNRVQASTLGGATRFLVDTANNSGLSQVLEEKDGGGALQARYSYGNELLAMARGGNTAFQVRDGFGSTRALTDTTGTITDRYQYDAYGNTVAAIGSTVNPHRYRGERLDSDSGLYLLRARYYKPAQGRFVTRDPFAGRAEAPGSQHRYQYANGDPVNRVDPTGRESLFELISVQAGEAALDVAEALPEAVAARCAALGTAEQASVAIEVAGLGLALASSMGGLAGGVNTNEVGYVSPEIPGNGLKEFKFALKTGGGVKAEFTAGFAFHSGKAVEGKVAWPPLELGANFKDAVEWTIWRIRYCYVPLGKLVAKVEGSNGTATKGEGAYGVASFAGTLEASLFHGALTFGMPLFEAKEEAGVGAFSLFGGAFGWSWPKPAK